MESLILGSEKSSVFFRCVEDSNDAIMVCDRTGKLIYVNPAWSRIYGFSRHEAMGATPRLLHSGLQSETFYSEMWAQILDPAVGHWKGELVNKAKDGTLVPVLLTITPYRAESGAIEGFMGIAVDMTQKRELEAKVAHQDRLASIGMLASGLAHEIGTPLGVVRGRAEFLAMKADDAFIKKNLDVITSEIDRISKLIRSLLRMSRSFSDVQLENLKLQTVGEELISLVSQNFREEKTEIRIEIPEGLEAKADRGRLEQVLLNLVMNSLHAIKKARRSEGALGTPERSHFLRIAARPESGGRVSLQVEDSGCGIPAANMPKLFKPFFTTKDVGEGTGLGLAIVAQLVREMGGVISVKSTVGVGTSFFVTLAAG